MTFIRVRRPVLPKRPSQAATRTGAPENQATAEGYAEKGYVMLNLRVTVYLRGSDHFATELRWGSESAKTDCRAWSNADFR